MKELWQQCIIIKVDEEGKNIKLVDSWIIKDKEKQIKIIKKLLNEHEWFRKRSLKSYLHEWRAHNILYRWKFKVQSTKDTDLNINERLLRRLGYFILDLLFRQ